MPTMTDGFNAGSVVFGPDRPRSTRYRTDVSHDIDGESGAAGEGFLAFSETIRRELEPSNVLEGVLVDRIILGAWDLQIVSTSMETGAPMISRRDEARAERTLIRGLDALGRLRAGALSQWGRPAPSSPAGPIDETVDPMPAVEFIDDRPWYSRVEAVEDGREEPVAEPEPDASHLWVGRLVFEPNVSEDSPVVRGTWVTVGHVVSLVVDGWSWADILRSHPELSEADIRACLAYAVEEENASLPLDS